MPSSYGKGLRVLLFIKRLQPGSRMQPCQAVRIMTSKLCLLLEGSAAPFVKIKGCRYAQHTTSLDGIGHGGSDPLLIQYLHRSDLTIND